MELVLVDENLQIMLFENQHLHPDLKFVNSSISVKEFLLDYHRLSKPCIIMESITDQQRQSILELIQQQQILTNEKYLVNEEEPIFKTIEQLQVTFSKHILELDNIEIYQGQLFENRAYSIDQDQIMCSLQKPIIFFLVSALQRESVYPIKMKDNQYKSSVDLVYPNNIKYPLFEMAFLLKSQLLEGECLYVPAYWFIQVETQEEDDIVLVNYKYINYNKWTHVVFKGIQDNKI